MSVTTFSEQLFEELCTRKHVAIRRIPVDESKTPDYEVRLGPVKVLVEVKQLDENSEDQALNAALCRGEPLPPILSQVKRVRKQIADGYVQLKAGARAQVPTILVLYNNAGLLRSIDSFTVTRAMFGEYGVKFGLPRDVRADIQVLRQGFMGHRKLTRNTCCGLSVVAVLKDARWGSLRLDAYHNPFAEVALGPSKLAYLAIEQYMHPNPHDGLLVDWEPVKITN